MEKRAWLHKQDPLEELSEVYADVKDMENNFKKVLEVCSKYNSPFILCSVYDWEEQGFILI